MNTSITKNVVGVDISKNTLDVHIHPLGKEFKIPNSKEAISKLLKQLTKYDVEHIVCEASGGYDYLLLKLAKERSFNIWQVEPKIIRAFIVSEGIKAKTDKIDARHIALFASQKKPKHLPKDTSNEEEQLKALCRHRANLIRMITMETNRLKHPQQVYCQKHIKKHISFMKKEVEKIDVMVDTLIRKNDCLNIKSQILASIPGVGKVTILALLSHMPELGTSNDKQIASLLGVAPFDNQSGKFRGKSGIKGGRRHVRKAVYMAAISAIRCNAILKEFYQRLRDNGKAAKIAIIAVMRKLITIINVMLKNGETWRLA